jgi:hypothetical protein
MAIESTGPCFSGYGANLINQSQGNRMKKCNKCNELKDEKLFSFKKRSKDGLSTICKTCCKRKPYTKKHVDDLATYFVSRNF